MKKEEGGKRQRRLPPGFSRPLKVVTSRGAKWNYMVILRTRWYITLYEDYYVRGTSVKQHGAAALCSHVTGTK